MGRKEGTREGVLMAEVEALRRRNAELEKRECDCSRIERELRFESSFDSAIMEHAIEGVFACRSVEGFPGFRFTRWNRRMVEITGYTAEEMNSLGCCETVCSSSETCLGVLLFGEAVKGKELEIIHKDGATRIVLVSTPQLEVDEESPYVLVLLEDITDQRRMEEAIAKNHKELGAIIDTIPGVVNAVDKEYNIVDVSDRLLAEWGLPARGDVLGRNCYTVYQDRASPCPNCWAEKVFVGANLLEGESGSCRKWGNGWAVKRYFSPLVDQRGKVWGALECAMDITELKVLETQLGAARAAAGVAGQAKDEFLANMSHELRTPLNGVLGMLQLLQSVPLEKEALGYVEVAFTSGKGMLGLIDDILDFSEINAGVVEIRPEETDIREVFESMTELFQKDATAKGLRLHWSVAQSLPRTMLIDNSRLKQILLNLVGNAVKFTEQGDVRVHAGREVGLGDGKDLRICFTVEDTGIGIPRQKVDLLLEPFTQADSSFSRKYPGTGLGLAVVKRLVDLMGGQLGIDSEEGKGTSVAFSLALNPAVSLSRTFSSSVEEEPGFAIDGDELLK